MCLCCVYEREDGSHASNRSGKLSTSRRNKKAVHLLPSLLFSSVQSIASLYCPPPPSLFPVSSELCLLRTSCLNTPPAAPALIVTATRSSPAVRSTGATLFARGGLPRCSKDDNVYLEKQTVKSIFYKTAQAADSKEKRSIPTRPPSIAQTECTSRSPGLKCRFGLCLSKALCVSAHPS